MNVIDINNGMLVAQADKLEGIAGMDVINGGWSGKIDWENMEYWSDRYPEITNKITSWKIAVKGEHQYY